ncbi:hypothetical protein SEA_GUWAPP_20 [Mycobacterium phage Guwapp]|uniref:Uncharacterized protein n=2 Tax=Bixzunavirus Bxz1 TaxID=2006134 RepID=B5LK11_9CAUD|nr:gp20 [Mycobacterium phage Rizal]YP_009221151.1 hypothetical protein AWH68_gp021 [Mycobacterium phage Breeniome]AOZ63378.1 hypothetical protein SEA_GABRIEL_21 [Mycobacterium phage Gabriel]AWY09649.1 hypothetical protein SEA_DEREK_21 [Mycobacterium phage Derek]USH45623.1 hypothetical protein SEA_GUWAPP_20 [Mycobacterium phage Guwapp]ACH62257.1 hypothetical protein RIZAL_20 [Mycobacterium phage Rizal]AGV99505.1 hypothetical protein PBI_BREENIOME_21 [Mycobacterium phage Breeniome]
MIRLLLRGITVGLFGIALAFSLLAILAELTDYNLPRPGGSSSGIGITRNGIGIDMGGGIMLDPSSGRLTPGIPLP